MPPNYRHPYRLDDWATTIYPMPSFAHLSSADVERSSRWYQDVLGFADVYTARAADGAPLIAHLRWCTFGDLLLTPDRAPIDGPRGLGVTLNFAADDVDAIAERARAAGAAIAEGPVDRPWNTRDVALVDPDGYRLNFTAPQRAMLERVAAGRHDTMDDVVARLRGGNA